MGKEKIEEKDVRLLRYAVEQAFDGAMRDGALALLNRLVDSASEAANLEEELLNLKGEYQRSMENSKRGAFKRLDAAYKRKSRISSNGTEEAALWSALRPESAMSPSKPLWRSMETDRKAPGRGLAIAVEIPIAPLTANIGAIQMIWSQE